MSKTAANVYLERPYSTVLIWDRETATYTAKIAEFSGCVTEGKTAGEALKRLKSAARSWIEAVLDSGQPVPEPVAEQEYSGRLLLRLPRSLHRRVAELAQADGISLNQFIATTLAERVGTGGARAGTTTNMLVFIAPQALPMPQPSLRTMNFQTLARKEIQLLRSAGTAD